MIIQTATTSFTEELLQGIHDFANDTFKLALYTVDASLGADTTAYTTTGETSGSGYTAGGVTLTGSVVSSSNGVSFVDFGDAVWSGALTARGGLIYNSSKSNRSVAILNFGADKTSTSTFTVQMPVASATTALIRISKGV